MKKCPYCAEEIQEEAILCRYCGKELNNLLLTHSKKKETYKPELPPEYVPPQQHIDRIYESLLQKLRGGEWVLAPLHMKGFGHYPFNGYNGKISSEEYSRIKNELNIQAWVSSDKTPDGVLDLFIKFRPKKPLFSVFGWKWIEMAYRDAEHDLRFFYEEFTKRNIIERYKSYLKSIRAYAFTQHSKLNKEITPIENLNRIAGEPWGKLELMKIPIEYQEAVIEEARNQISSMSYKNYKLFVPLSYRPNIGELFRHMDFLADAIAKKLADYHKQAYPEDSPHSIIIDSKEISEIIDEKVKDNEQYDDGLKSMLYSKVKNKLGKYGCM